jgi:flagellar basal-body rod modification protein FlgD
MQNQDPTSQTDPNEYIDQLVDVNSLEQLININQTLSSAYPAASTGATGDAALAQSASPATGASPSATPAGQSAAGHAAQSLGALTQNAGAPAASQASPATGELHTPTPQAVRRAPGNLSVPAANPAAQRVAHSLDAHPGRPRARPLGGKLSRLEQTAPNNRP